MYGIDGASYNLVDVTHPGCTTKRCDPFLPCTHGTLADGCQHGSSMCGFVGAPPTAWNSLDLKLILTMHANWGTHYTKPAFHSGYNEAIIGAATFNAKLPHAVDAFFVLDAAHAHADAMGVDSVRAHRAFLDEYGLTEADVPLLKLTPEDWDAPLQRFEV